MTVQEAIRELHNIRPLGGIIPQKRAEAIDIAIKCMEEVEQYRALGTVEEIKKKIKTELPYMSLAQARFKSELDEYRNIGTVEELREAREKQVAKKPNMEQKDEMGNGIERCPNCLSFGISGYCMECGQKIDWGEEDD